MAKLDNVKVVNENTVEYNGFVYELVTDGGKPSDLIQCFEKGLGHLTYEAFYEVINVDSWYDMDFLDDANDYRERDHKDEDWKVFRKSHAITNDKLADAEGVVKIELPDGTKLEGTPSDLEKITRSMQALQSEQVASVEMPEEVVEEEAASEPVSERLQVGDYAKVITHDDNGQSKFGDIVKVTEDDETDVPFNTEHLDGRYAGWHYENDLVCATEAEVKAATEPKVEPLKVGDYAKVVEDGSHEFKENDVVHIYDIVDYGPNRIRGEYLSGKRILRDYFYERELVKATDKEVREAKQALLKEGEFARVIANTSSHKFEIGTVVKLKSHNSDIKSFTAYYIDESDFWGVYSKDLEPLTAEEAEHIAREAEEEKKAKAELNKWAAIGREVGEYKKGDVVLVIDKGSSDLYVDEIGTVSFVDSDDTVRVITVNCDEDSANWLHTSRIVLVVPVEQRFDTVG